MNPVILLALVAALLAVTTLFSGVSSMAHGGDADREQSVYLMFRRVGWQLIAIVMLGLSLLVTVE